MFQRLCRFSISRRKVSAPNSLLLSFHSAPAPTATLPRATTLSNRRYSLFQNHLPTTSTTLSAITPHYFSTFTSGNGDQDDQDDQDDRGNDGQDDTWDKGEQDEEWDDADFSDDEEDGIDVSQSIQAGEETFSYRVNDPNESLFIDPGEYLEVQRRKRRALRDDSEYKGPITRDVLMKAKMPGELWHPRLIQYSQSSVTRKGGRVNSFRALIVLGNGQGSAGFGFGKGVNMRFAIEDATMKAYRDVVSIPLYENRTLHHDCLGKYNNVKVQMRSARPGYGLKAGPVMNAICDCFGIRDCVTRVHGGSNRYTVVHAAFKSFENYRSVEQAALARGQRLVDVNDLMEEHYANDLYHKWGKLDGVSEYRKSKRKNQTKF